MPPVLTYAYRHLRNKRLKVTNQTQEDDFNVFLLFCFIVTWLPAQERANKIFKGCLQGMEHSNFESSVFIQFKKINLYMGFQQLNL